MRSMLLSGLMLLSVGPALSSERVTVGGELICFKRDALKEFAALLRAGGPSVVQSFPGCIAAQPGLVLTKTGSAGRIEGVGTVSQIRAVSPARREFFDGFTNARF